MGFFLVALAARSCNAAQLRRRKRMVFVSLYMQSIHEGQLVLSHKKRRQVGTSLLVDGGARKGNLSF